MPATESENRLPGNSLVLGATIEIVFAVASWKPRARPTILKLDESDPILGSNHGELSCIFALITGDDVEFNVHADHGLHEY